MPNTIKAAVFLILLQSFIFAVISLVDFKSGLITSFDFILELISYSIFLIFPYFISKGGNKSRWIYVVLSIFSTFVFLGFSLEELGITTNLHKTASYFSVFANFIVITLLTLPRSSRDYFY